MPRRRPVRKFTRTTPLFMRLEEDAFTWLVVQAGAGADSLIRAAYFLGQQDYAVFLPRVFNEIKAGEPQQAFKPLFPGYLFCGLSAGQAVAPITATRGVRDVLRTPDGSPSTIDAVILREIQGRIDADGGAAINVRKAERESYKKGEPLRVTQGVFRGINGLFSSRERDRIKILLDICGRAASVSVPAEHVTRI